MYRYAIGTDDPRPVEADTDDAAIARTVALLRAENMADLKNRPQAVLTLMGPSGPLTRPSERLDEFVERLLPGNPAADPERLQPGDLTSPDCNAD